MKHIFLHDNEVANRIAKLVEEAYPYMEEFFYLPDTVNISITTDIKARGLMGFSGGVHSVWIKQFKRYSPYGIISTLAHELAHVEQYYTGRMEDDGNYFRWNGKLYDLVDYDTLPYKEYINLPWEKEAIELSAMFVKMHPFLYKRKSIFTKLKEYVLTKIRASNR